MNKGAVYLEKNPKVARSRVTNLVADGCCYFVKEKGRNVALLPEKSAADDFVMVDLENLTCGCNVFRTKKCCPHVAAALTILDGYQGKIPYVDPVRHVFACLGKRESRKPGMSDQQGNMFFRNVIHFLPELPEDRRLEYLYRLSVCMEKTQTRIPGRDFLDCAECLAYERERVSRSAFSDAGDFNDKAVAYLYENRGHCYYALSLLLRNWPGSFNADQKGTILAEISQDDSLADMCMPMLAGTNPEAFSRKQLGRYYKTCQAGSLPGNFYREYGKKLLAEDPPMCKTFLNMLKKEKAERNAHLFLGAEQVAILMKAGYGEDIEKYFESLVGHLSGIEEYHVLREVSPRLFHKAWEHRMKEKEKRYYWYDEAPETDLEIEINLYEYPDRDLEDYYYLERFSTPLLKTLLEVRPEYRGQAIRALRKNFRAASKEGKDKDAAEALFLLARYGDTLAAKYADNWHYAKDNQDFLVYKTMVLRECGQLAGKMPGLTKMPDGKC